MKIQNDIQDIPDEDSLRIVFYILSGAYGLLVIFAFVAHFRRKKLEIQIHWGKLFFPLIVLGCTIRSVYFGISPFILKGSKYISNPVDNLLSIFPSFLFFSAYLIILFLWMEIYYNTLEVAFNHFKLLPIYVIINCLMYAVIFSLFMVDFFQNSDEFQKIATQINPYEVTLIVFDTSLYLLSSIGFLIYGHKLYWKVSVTMRKGARELLLRKILILASMLCICFIIRAILVPLSAHFIIIDYLWYSTGGYYLFLEVFPLALMVFILSRSSKQNTLDETSPLVQ